MTNDEPAPSAAGTLTHTGDAYESLHRDDLTAAAPPYTDAGAAYDEALGGE